MEGSSNETPLEQQSVSLLNAQPEHYRSIIGAVQEGIWMVDADFRTTFVNARMTTMLGYTAEEMMGRPVTDFMHPPEAQAFAQQRQERVAGKARQYDGKYRRKDGSDLWVIVSATPLTEAEDRFTGAIALMADITDRKHLEMEQARMAAIIAFSEDAIVSKDLNGIVTSWNAAAERLYGWTAAEMIGRSKAQVIPPDLPEELETILGKIRRGERIQHYETRRMHKNGTLFDVAISVSPVKDAQGRIIGAATIVRDITERRRTERELQRRQTEVEALNMRLKRAMQETHHRVKNNLQIVSAMIDMQSMEHREAQSVPIQEFDRLSRHIRTLAAVHDLLTRSLQEEENAQRVSSAAVIGELMALLEATGGSQIQAQVDDTPLLSKQAVTLSLTINELVSNAVKHASGQVEITFEALGPLAELRVSDNGPGFPPGFDPISHANLGLELVQSLVETDLKGQTRFENRTPTGACVRVTFPLPRDT